MLSDFVILARLREAGIVPLNLTMLRYGTEEVAGFLKSENGFFAYKFVGNELFIREITKEKYEEFLWLLGITERTFEKSPVEKVLEKEVVTVEDLLNAC